MNRKKVLLIIPELKTGGAQFSFVSLAGALQNHYDVSIVVFNNFFFNPHIVTCPIYSLNDKKALGTGMKLFNFIKRIKTLRNLKGSVSPDISISFLEGADYVNVLSRNGERVILSVRGSKKFDQNIRGWMGWLRHKLLIPWLYNKADVLVALNKGIRGELIDDYHIRKPIHVIYNFFDIPNIQTLAMQPLTPDEEPIFTKRLLVSHGRLAPEKGYAYFLEVFQRLQTQNLRLLLIGDGPERTRLERQCAKMGLPFVNWDRGQPVEEGTRVVFYGFCSNPFRLLNKATLFVFPSLHEGFGNSLLEAMACQVPVVAADCPYGPREILGESESLLPVLSNDPHTIDLWVEQIDQMLSIPNLSIEIQRNFEKASYFSRDNFMPIWEKILSGE